jgi:N-acetylmuramoyl-L-alanine amidase
MKIEKDFLTINPFSRPAKKINTIKGIVIHWVANPNTTFIQNRNFFENRKDGKSGYGSAHYIINLDRDVIQCIPDEEMAYHVGAIEYNIDSVKKLSKHPNNCTLGIECCHVDWDGKMTPETYFSLTELTAYLLRKYNLNIDNLYRHFDITGKNCHKWFVENPALWEIFKNEINKIL